MNRDEKKEILSNIQNQISAFDNKASIFLAAIGIVFALSISLFDVFIMIGLLKLLILFKQHSRFYIVLL